MKDTTIQEAQHLSSMKVDELICSLQTFELAKNKSIAFVSSVAVGRKIAPSSKSQRSRVQTESPPILIYSNKRKEKISINPQRKEMVIATKLGFASRLCKRKVLASLTSIVLDGTY